MANKAIRHFQMMAAERCSDHLVATYILEPHAETLDALWTGGYRNGAELWRPLTTEMGLGHVCST